MSVQAPLGFAGSRVAARLSERGGFWCVLHFKCSEGKDMAGI